MIPLRCIGILILAQPKFQPPSNGIRIVLVVVLSRMQFYGRGISPPKTLICLGSAGDRGKVPILTAGTGLYLRALLEGLSEAPARSESLRARLRLRSAKHGPQYLHRLLSRLDPEAAARIAGNDTQKVIRAIEIRTLTGKSIGEVHRTGRTALDGYPITKDRVDAASHPKPALRQHRTRAHPSRCSKAGWIDEECERCMASGSRVAMKSLSGFIGYTELRHCVEGHLTEESAVKTNPANHASVCQLTKITWFFRREVERALAARFW